MSLATRTTLAGAARPAPRRSGKPVVPARAGLWQAALALAVVLLLVALPLGQLLWSALVRDGRLAPGPALAEMGSRSATLALWHSLATGLASSALATLAGGLAAFATTLARPPGARLFGFAFVLSMMVAPQVTALAFIQLASPGSPLLNALGIAPAPGTPNLVRTPAGIVAVLALHHAPLAFVVVRAGLRRIPLELVEAAALDGAGAWRTFRSVLAPLLRRHGATAALLCFVAALGNFGIPALLGLPTNYLTLPTFIYRRLTSFGPAAIADAAAACLPLLALALAATAAARILEGRAPPLEAGRSIEGAFGGRVSNAIIAAALLALLLVAVALPLASLLSTALVPAFGVPLDLRTLTLDHVREVFWRQEATGRAFRNSVAFAGVAALVVAVLALPLAFGLARRLERVRPLVEGLVELPYALPGVILAVAFILVALRSAPLVGLALYGGPVLIVLAYVSRFLALALKPLTAAMAQLDPAVEEAAELCGAGWWARLRWIVLPAVAPALVSGAILAFLLCVNELTVSALLWSARTQTIGVLLFGFEEAGLPSEAAVVALGAVAIVLAAMLVLDRLGSSLPEGSLPWR